MNAPKSNLGLRALQLSVALALALGVSHSLSALEISLRIPGIEGESTDSDHKGEIVVLNVEQTVGSKKTCPEYAITKFVDKSSPLLVDAANKGSLISSAVLTMRKSGEGQRDFYRLAMTNVNVLSVQESIASTDVAATEKIVLSAKIVVFGYKPQDEKGGLSAEVVSTLTC